MTTLIDRIETRSANGRPATDNTTPAQRLRSTMAAARVSFTWFGTQKTLDPRAEGPGRRGLRRRGPVPLRRQEADRHQATPPSAPSRRSAARSTRTGRGMSLPYPEPGVRLIRHDVVEEFAAQMADFRAELDDAVANLDRHYGELKQAAARAAGQPVQPGRLPRDAGRPLRRRRGTSPPSSRPTTCVQLSPGLYEQERARVAARFDEAVQLAEQAFLEEFARLVAHLTERITGVGEDGQPRVFRDSAVDNLSEFFDRFRELNVRSNEQLDELVARGPAGGPGRRRPGPPRRRAGCASGWRRSSRGSRPRSTRCWSSGPGGASCGRHRRRGRRDATWSSTHRPGPSDLRRGDRPGHPRPPRRSSAPATSSPTATAAGRPTCGPSAGRCSARSATAARPWRPSGPGWKRTGSRRRPEPSGREPGGPCERQQGRPRPRHVAPTACRAYVRSIGITIHPQPSTPSTSGPPCARAPAAPRSSHPEGGRHP